MNREGINNFIDTIGHQFGMKDNVMRIGIKVHIDKLEADKLEMAKAILEIRKIQERNYGNGMRLHLDMITYADENKHLFEKANKYIKEVEK